MFTRKTIRFSFWVLIILLIVIAVTKIGFWDSLYGALMGLMFFGTSYMIKFGGEKKINIKEDWFMLLYSCLPVLVITYFCYASIYLFYYGTDSSGKISNIESHIEWEGSGENTYP